MTRTSRRTPVQPCGRLRPACEGWPGRLAPRPGRCTLHGRRPHTTPPGHPRAVIRRPIRFCFLRWVWSRLLHITAQHLAKALDLLDAVNEPFHGTSECRLWIVDC